MGCGSGMTCWRRLRDWQKAGVWESPHHVILQNLHDTKKIDWSRACIDGSVIQAKRGRTGGEHTGPNPVDRGRPGSKHHLITNRNGIPLVVGLTAANVNDCKMLEYMLDHLPSLRNLHGRPTCRPQKLHADKGYTVPLILESTAGLLSEPLPGSIDTGACSSDMNAGLISIWLFSPLLPL